MKSRTKVHVDHAGLSPLLVLLKDTPSPEIATSSTSPSRNSSTVPEVISTITKVATVDG